ncbi:MAG: subclass B3 metallo-beta-lactamase [Marinicaulis sp.]|nr:subclass B3 metallo-beta-lactamase [Marinicaulis sp.]
MESTIDRKAAALEAAEAWAERQPHWVEPFEPFRIIGNLYYVGTQGLAVYLITDYIGHAISGAEYAAVVIDGGMAGNEQIIIDNIAKLGFDIKDVKYLLNTHAHFDHSGGLAKLKTASNAELTAAEGDVSALEGGFYLGFEQQTEYFAPPVTVDKSFKNDEDLLIFPIGNAALTGVVTPGHSRGCTSWRLSIEDNGEEYEVLIFCSATVALNSLVPKQYDGIVGDYRYTFETTKEWKPDVFLANHPEVFYMKETREKQKAGDPLAFVNRGAFQRYIRAKERAFERAFAEQQAAASDQE